MMRSFITLGFLAAAGVAHAQSSSSSTATATSTASPLIPTSVSSSCSSFLQSLNSNSTLASCIAPVVNATSAFSPLSNSTVNATSSAVNSALTTLCATNSLSAGCDDATIRGQLTSMYTACTEELTGASPNTDVVRLYDVLYAIVPMKDAVCSKDDSGKYCVTQAASPSSQSLSQSGSAEPSASISVGGSKSFVTSAKQNVYELVENNLWSSLSGSAPLSKRGPEDTAALVPNTTTFRKSNLPFLFLSASQDSSSLCTSCTRSVLTAYITFEQSVPYALGITNSPMLGGQTDLYNAVVSECGSSFLSGAVQAAGGIADGIVSSAISRLAPAAEGGFVAAAAAAVLGLATLL